MRPAVMVPTYNEADNLPALAEALLALDVELHLVVVDDASPDGTGRIADTLAEADERVHIIHRTGPRGYSHASREGLRWCLDAGFDPICTMDADLSHDPDVVVQLLTTVESGADVAIGSRYVEGGALAVDWGPVRRAVSKLGSAYARFMVGTPVRDCTSGFRCYRADVLSRIPFEEIPSGGYSFLIELLAELVARDAKIVEVPITYVDRRAGSSKISRSIILEALVRTTALGIRRFTGRRRPAEHA